MWSLNSSPLIFFSKSPYLDIYSNYDTFVRVTNDLYFAKSNSQFSTVILSNISAFATTDFSFFFETLYLVSRITHTYGYPSSSQFLLLDHSPFPDYLALECPWPRLWTSSLTILSTWVVSSSSISLNTIYLLMTHNLSSSV